MSGASLSVARMGADSARQTQALPRALPKRTKPRPIGREHGPWDSSERGSFESPAPSLNLRTRASYAGRIPSMVFLSICLILLCGCRNEPSSGEIWIYGAEPAVQKELTNFLVGYTRTIDIQINWGAQHPSNWTAVAVAERLNQHGGVERATVPFRFYAGSNYIVAKVDSDLLWERQKKAAQP
jgi:hypothetical protein